MKFTHGIRFPFFLILILIGASTSTIIAENTDVDSLLEQLLVARQDTNKVNVLIDLASKTVFSDIKAAEQYARRALQLSQKINYTKGLAYSNYWLAMVYVDNEFDLAESLAIQSLEFANEINDEILIAMVYKVIGNLYTDAKRYNDALSYYNKSLDLLVKLNQDSIAAAIYSNLGILQSEMHGDIHSIDYYLKAAEINQRTKNYLWLTTNYLNIGSDYIKFGQLEKGKSYLDKSLKITNENDFARVYPYIFSNYCVYFIEIKNYDSALIYAQKALDISRDHSNKIMELEALNHLKDIYYKKNDLKKTFSIFGQITSVTDSINKYKQLKELDLMEMRFRYEEAHRAQELENAVLKANHYRKELTYVLIILFAGFVIFIFLFLYIAQRNRTHRKILEQKTTQLENEKLSLENEKISNDLEYKNKELATNVIYSIQKNKVLTGLIEGLVEIEKNAVKEETKDAIQKISKKINESLESNAWEEFEVRFQQVHKAFYETLSVQHPDLTPNEKRLCAFLRLDMSSKEISRLTGQSISAIVVARTRLRKKLGITNTEQNLVTFLSQY